MQTQLKRLLIRLEIIEQQMRNCYLEIPEEKNVFFLYGLLKMKDTS